jgi:hypothetical protein
MILLFFRGWWWSWGYKGIFLHGSDYQDDLMF